MSKVNLDETKKIAKLSRIYLDDDARKELSQKVSNVIEWVESLNEVNTDDVEPMMAVENTLRMRSDEVNDGDKREEVLSNAPDRKIDFYAVPKVIEQND